MKNLLLTISWVVSFSTAFAQTPTWHQVHTILVDNCMGAGCHSGSNPGFDLTETRSEVWQDLINTTVANPASNARGEKMVFPGQPYQSFLLKKIAHGLGSYASPDLDLKLADGADMPDNGPALSAEEVELIRQWIIAGADSTTDYPTADPSLIARYYSGAGLPFMSPPPLPDPDSGYQIHIGPIFYNNYQSEHYFAKFNPQFNSDLAVVEMNMYTNEEVFDVGIHYFQNAVSADSFPTGASAIVPSVAHQIGFQPFWFFRDELELKMPIGMAMYFDQDWQYNVEVNTLNTSDTILPVEVYMNVYTSSVGQGSFVEMKREVFNNTGLNLVPNANTLALDYRVLPGKYLWGLLPYTRSRALSFEVFQMLNSVADTGIYDGAYDYSTGTPSWYNWRDPSLMFDNNSSGIFLREGIVSKVDYVNAGTTAVMYGYTQDDELMLTQVLYSDQLVNARVEILDNTNGTFPVCEDSVTLNLSVPFLSYIWSTGDTTPSTTVYESGVYTVTTTDGLGVTHTPDPKNVQFDSLTVGFDVWYNGAWVHANADSSSYPQYYTWKRDGTEIGTGPNTTTINPYVGRPYLLTMVATDTCSNTDSISQTLYTGNIIGHIFQDDNSNGVWDQNEQPLRSNIVEITPGPYYGVTRQDGTFFASVPDGSYTATWLAPSYWNPTIPASGTLNFTVSSGIASDTLDFGAIPTPGITDVAIMFVPNTMVSGFNNTSWLKIKNLGTDTVSGEAVLELDQLLAMNNSYPQFNNHAGNRYIWNYSDLLPGEERTILLDLFSSVVNFGAYFATSATITPIVGDVDVSNNTFNFDGQILGAYDPNDKQISPSRENNEILFGEKLDYTIRFQNIGNYKAANVRIEDTLDANLDVSTIEILGSSHPVEFIITGSHNLIFFFDNINLPDSTSDEPGSHGYVMYRILPKEGLPINTVIENTANIYFDFQEAVVTNTTANVLVELISDVEELQQQIAKVYPNPAKDKLYVVGADISSGSTIMLYDLSGKLLLTQVLGDRSVDITSLDNGMYLYTIENSTGNLRHGKLLIER